jgi:hypothetical protein
MSGQTSFEKREIKIFDTEYTVKIALVFMVAIGLIFLSWTYHVKNNVIITMNDTNAKMFNERFGELSAQSAWGDYGNIGKLAQRQVTVMNIDRSGYGIDRSAFGSLPLIPEDWGKIKYAYDQGQMFVINALDSNYYMQPEFYDDWFALGLPFFKNHTSSCSTGVFAEPLEQKMYTVSGSTIGTYFVIRSSFCVDERQAVKLAITYPSSSNALESSFTQDPNVVKKYITASINPDVMILGQTYPKFSKDWAKRINITVTVADNTPKGIYVVSLALDKYEPWSGKSNDVNYDAYKSKNGAPLANIVLAVD